MSYWTQRVRTPAPPPELQQIRAAAQDLAQQSHHAPGKVRLVFQTVADISLITTAVISGALASVGLYKALFPRHRPSPEAAAGGSPPRRGDPPTTQVAAATDGPGERHRPDDSSRSR